MASDYDIVLANFKMKLKVECCPNSIRIRFQLDKLKEPEIESGVPDSDWWKVHNPQSEIEAIANDIKEGLLVTVEEVPGGNGENPDLDYERNFGRMWRETRTEGVRHPDDEARSSTNIAQRGQEEDEINQRELDRWAVWCHGKRNESRKQQIILRGYDTLNDVTKTN